LPAQAGEHHAGGGIGLDEGGGGAAQAAEQGLAVGVGGVGVVSSWLRSVTSCEVMVPRSLAVLAPLPACTSSSRKDWMVSLAWPSTVSACAILSLQRQARC
jgi:hypothetical protein